MLPLTNRSAWKGNSPASQRSLPHPGDRQTLSSSLQTHPRRRSLIPPSFRGRLLPAWSSRMSCSTSSSSLLTPTTAKHDLVGLMDRQLSLARASGMSSVLQRVGSMPLLGDLHERRGDRSVIWNHPAHDRIWTDHVWRVLIEDAHG